MRYKRSKKTSRSKTKESTSGCSLDHIFLDDSDYVLTSEISSNIDVCELNRVQLVVKNSRKLVCLYLVFFHGIQLALILFTSIDFRQTRDFLFFQVLLSIGAIMAWSKFFYFKPILIVNEKGIKIFENEQEINWEKVLKTYIVSSTSRSGSITKYLLIEYFDNFKDEVQKVTLDLSVLDVSNKKLSDTIEFFKSSKSSC